jgi:putative membrane protein
MPFYGAHGWTWGLGFGSFLVWALAAVAIATLLRPFARGHRLVPATAEQILAERFARGEISQDEFYERIATQPGPASLPG